MRMLEALWSPDIEVSEVSIFEHHHSTVDCIFDIATGAIIVPYPGSHSSNAPRQAPPAFIACLGLVRISDLLRASRLKGRRSQQVGQFVL
ncbi:hypothetical protein IFM47457_03115, partial [Aspergillus lentulus]